MTDPLHDHALVIMAKAPRAGRVKTRLEPVVPADALVALYRCMIEDTVALARVAGVARIAVMCPRGDGGDVARWLDIEVVEQEGDGLAAGLDSVFRLFVGDGCPHVIAFNGDTPHLPPDTLAGAFRLLARHDLVVGPTEDGGYYLVGARGAHAGLFEPHGLGTGGALRSLLARAAERGLGVALTKAWYDVDEASDLARLAAELRRTPARAPRTATWLSTWNGRTP
jgi:rSAM/selenodomain-associated transferase 1